MFVEHPPPQIVGLTAFNQKYIAIDRKEQPIHQQIPHEIQQQMTHDSFQQDQHKEHDPPQTSLVEQEVLLDVSFHSLHWKEKLKFIFKYECGFKTTSIVFSMSNTIFCLLLVYVTSNIEWFYSAMMFCGIVLLPSIMAFIHYSKQNATRVWESLQRERSHSRKLHEYQSVLEKIKQFWHDISMKLHRKQEDILLKEQEVESWFEQHRSQHIPKQQPIVAAEPSHNQLNPYPQDHSPFAMVNTRSLEYLADQKSNAHLNRNDEQQIQQSTQPLETQHSIEVEIEPAKMQHRHEYSHVHSLPQEDDLLVSLKSGTEIIENLKRVSEDLNLHVNSRL